MLHFLQRIIPSVVWETAETLVIWVHSLLRGVTPKIKGPSKHEAVAVPRIKKFDEAKQLLKILVGMKEQALKSRSTPNERLAITFKIENGFTTMSLDTHAEYVNHIHELLKMVSYYSEQILIKDIFETEKAIFVKKYGENIPFLKYILTVSFKFSIKRFLGELLNDKLTEADMSDLCLKAGDKITSLWLESKKGPVDWEEQKALFDILQILFPSLNVEDKLENPLNIILPSFETLWRVMYRLCVTVQCSDEADLYLKVLRQFGEDPSEATFKNKVDGVSAEFIVKEILFVNPPTRTIYRSDENGNIVGVDVKVVHMEGVEIKGFYPQRWGNDKDIPFLTFGYGSMSCPAKRFAPVALALMGAAIFEIFEYYAWNVELKKIDAEGKNDRVKYFEFEIKKVK